MGIHMRSDSAHWRIEFVLRGRRYARSSGTSDAAEARDIEAAWRLELRNANNFGELALSAMDVKEACDRYEREVVLPKRHTLKRSIQAAVDRLKLIRKHFGDETPIASITKADLASYRSALMTKGTGAGGVNRQLTVIQAVLAKAIEWGELTEAPKLKRLHVHDERDRILSPDEEHRLMAAASPDLADLIMFLIDTGARRAEALSLTWADIDLTDGAACVVINTRKAKRVLRRRVPLTPRVVDLLTRRKATNTAKPWPWNAENGKTASSRRGRGGRRVARSTPERAHGVYRHSRGGYDARIKVAGELLHLGHFAKRKDAVAARIKAEADHYGVDNAGLDTQWERACDNAGIEDLGMHDCRHTFASRLASKNLSLGLIGELLGHSDPRMTKRYAHYQQGDTQAAVLAALLNTKPPRSTGT